MDKPISVIVEEFRNNIINTINTTALPPSVMEYVLKDMLNEIHLLSVKQMHEYELNQVKQLAKGNSETTENIE